MDLRWWLWHCLLGRFCASRGANAAPKGTSPPDPILQGTDSGNVDRKDEHLRLRADELQRRVHKWPTEPEEMPNLLQRSAATGSLASKPAAGIPRLGRNQESDGAVAMRNQERKGAQQNVDLPLTARARYRSLRQACGSGLRRDLGLVYGSAGTLGHAQILSRCKGLTLRRHQWGRQRSP